MTLFTRRNALKLGLAGGALALATPSQALVEIVVTGGNFTPLPIAIPDFASSDPAFGAEIAQIVRNNLKRSGLFVPLDPASLPIRVGDVSNNPDFAAWRAASGRCAGDGFGGAGRPGQFAGARVGHAGCCPGRRQVLPDRPAELPPHRPISCPTRSTHRSRAAAAISIRASSTWRRAAPRPIASRSSRSWIRTAPTCSTRSSGKALTFGLQAPSGDSLVFTSYEDGNPQVYYAGLGGSAKKLIQGAPMSFVPNFSPDGGSVVFSVSNGGTTNVYSATLSGQPTQLTSGAATDTSPSFARWRAHRVRKRSSGSPQLYLMGAWQGPAHLLWRRLVLDPGLLARREIHCLYPPVGRPVPYRHHGAGWPRASASCRRRTRCRRGRPGFPTAASSCSSAIRVAMPVRACGRSISGAATSSTRRRNPFASDPHLVAPLRG